MHKLFGIAFLVTGIFAIVGGLYTWGDGSIFLQTELLTVLIPYADMILTGPISILTGYAILKKVSWGKTVGLVTSGIYIFGSLLVYISIIWNSNYSIFLIVPSTTGLLIGISFVYISLRHPI